jgi:hypothetical protein
MKPQITAQDVDRACVAGGDITPHLDLGRATCPVAAPHVNVNIPTWGVAGLDAPLGITRQALAEKPE